jgi:hypothetical protein
LVADFGPWKSAYRRFSGAAKHGVWKEDIGAFAGDADFEHVFRGSGVCGSTRRRGGLTTKIHALAEGLENLACCKLTGDQTHDATPAEALLEGIEAKAISLTRPGAI